jgi:hypothetical protein
MQHSIEETFKTQCVSPVLDTFVFTSSLDFEGVMDIIGLVTRLGTEGNGSPWTLLQISKGAFNDEHPLGVSSRLKSLLPL